MLAGKRLDFHVWELIRCSTLQDRNNVYLRYCFSYLNMKKLSFDDYPVAVIHYLLEIRIYIKTLF